MRNNSPAIGGLKPGDVLPPAASIRSCFEPYLVPGDWEAAAEDARRSTRRTLWHRRALGWVRRVRRTQRSVAWNYDQQWAATALTTQLSRQGPGVACEWRGQKLLARAFGTKRVHLLHLLRALEVLRPESVLEVGAGNGVNLIAIGACLPGIRLSGIELTQGGVDAARAVAGLPRIPQILDEYVPLPLKSTALNGTIEFQRGDARALPFADRSFDVVYTVLALEQMEEIRDRALAEIARVARRWVVMVEPFRDFNDEGLRRSYIKSQDYFSARVADLARYGLEPIVVSADMPHKLTLKPAFVITSK